MMIKEKVNVLMMGHHVADVYLIRTIISVQEELDIDFEFVESLEQGLHRLRNKKFDALLLDLNLPDSKGIQTLEHVFDTTREIPVIVLSRLQETDLALRAIRMGAQDYLIKNRLTTDNLTRAILCSIERERVNQELAHMTKDILVATN